MVFCSIYFYKTMRENMIIWEKSVKRNQGLYASFLKKIKLSKTSFTFKIV